MTPNLPTLGQRAGLFVLLLFAACAEQPDVAVAGGQALSCSSDADCDGLDDGNPCTGEFRCMQSPGGARACRVDPSSVVQCAPGDGAPCAPLRCEPATGTCSPAAAPDGTPCDDGELCTVGDRCVDGGCQPGEGSLCACASDADCPDDDDLCNGTPFCDLVALPRRCRVAPTSVVTCDTSSDGPCEVSACVPATGACVAAPAHEGEACDDGAACTANDRCAAGICTGEQVCACATDSDCVDDGDLCNGVPYCDKSAPDKPVCATNPATIVACATAADTDCRKNTCSPKTGLCALQAVADKSSCDDGDSCTEGEACSSGFCTGGTETCSCSQDADCAGKDDGNPCNGTFFCNQVSQKCEHNPGSTILCASADDTPCSKNTCQPADGSCKPMARAAVKLESCKAVIDATGALLQFCVYRPKKAGEPADPGPFACDDGNPCTDGDLCQGSSCSSGAKICECKTDADCAAKEDGDPCNGTLYCNQQQGACVVDPSTIVSCDPSANTACTTNQCQKVTGACAATPRPDGLPCSDGDPCTAGDTCDKGVCAAGKSICACLEDADCPDLDGDLCTGVPYCDKSAMATGGLPSCKLNPATVVTCSDDDDGPCRKNVCDPKQGTCNPVFSADGASCEDGDPCTSGDACKAGNCAAGAKTCVCESDLDCAAKEDGNLCNGTLYCDKSGDAPSCKVNPKTVVSCDGSDDTACSKNLCNPSTGACQPVPGKDGTPCDDGDACTTGDGCKGGSCASGTAICDCQTDLDCAAKEDGDLCNGTLYCDKSGLAQGKPPTCAVAPATVVTCDSSSDSDCLKNLCHPKLGQCLPTPSAAGTGCEDGDPCTTGDTCKAGVCWSGTATCACKTDADCAGKEDGNLCNGTLRCEGSGAKAACVVDPATVVTCDPSSDTACIQATCQPKKGICLPQEATVGVGCDDGEACTVGDHCEAGGCKPGSSVCACVKDADCAGQDDDNLCNGTLHCDKSGPAPKCAVKPGSVVFCSPNADTACRKNRCAPASGTCAIQSEPQGSACDDGDPCTAGDGCLAGACKAGNAKDCDDGDPCTVDGCVAGKGCVWTPKLCDDGNTCTADDCNNKTGNCDLGNLALGASCDGDKSGCTIGDHCDGNGTCIVGLPASCTADKTKCLAGVCESKGSDGYACKVVPAPIGSDCDAADQCFRGAMCEASGCGVPTVPRLGTKVYGEKTGFLRLQGGTALPDGSIVVVGTRRNLGIEPSADNHGAALRLAEDGQIMWSKVIDQAGKGSGSGLETALTLPNSDVVLAGQTRSESGAQRLSVRRYSAGGNAVWSKTFLPVASPYVGAIRDNGSGTIALGYWSPASGTLFGVMQFTAAGDVSQSGPVYKTSADARLTSLRWLDDGGLLATVGATWNYTKAPSWLVRLDATGEAVSWTELGLSGIGGALDAHLLGSGEYVVHASEKGSMVTHRVSAAGKRRFTHWPGVDKIGAVQRLGGGRTLVAYHLQVGNARQIRVAGVDDFGNRQWTRASLTGEDFDQFAYGAFRIDDNTVAIVGSQDSGESGWQGIVARVDVWGHARCEDSGSCNTTVPEDCDDGTACTRDDCKLGQCAHENFAGSAARCDAEHGCYLEAFCSSGQCKPGGAGRLFARRPTPLTAFFAAYGMQGLRSIDGEISFLGVTQSQGWDPDVLVHQHLDELFAPLYTRSIAEISELVDHRACFGTSADSYWQLAQKLSYPNEQAKVLHFTKSATTSAALTGPTGSSAFPVDIASTPDGGVWATVGLLAAGSWSGKVARLLPNGNIAVEAPLRRCDGPGASGCVAATDVRPSASTVLEDATLVVVGTRESGGKAGAYLGRVATNGATMWSLTPSPDPQRWGYAIAKDGPKGLIWAGGEALGSGISVPVVGRVTTAGAATAVATWQGTPADGVALSVLAEADGGAFAAGSRKVGGNTPVAIWRFAADGSPLWTRTMQPQVDLYLTTHVAGQVVRLPDGYLVGAFGEDEYFGYSLPIAFRTDLWGNLSCAEAGLCGEKALETCDDNDPCTADACDAKTGCTHSTIAGCSP